MMKMAIRVITRERASSGGSAGSCVDAGATFTAASRTYLLKVMKIVSEMTIATAADMNARLHP